MADVHLDLEMEDFIKKYFDALFNRGNLTRVYVESKTPKEMMATGVNEDGWFQWKPLPGTLTNQQYSEVERKFRVKFPKSFVEWHKSWFFLEGDCSIVRLPESNPLQPLYDLSEELDYDLAKDLAAMKLYPFAAEGNDAGPLVFDARVEVYEDEYPIRVYNHEYCGDLDGLSEIIFSSFTKLIECVTHYLKETKTRHDFEVIPEFFQIDPKGAGRTGVDYWLYISALRKHSYEYFKDDDLFK